MVADTRHYKKSVNLVKFVQFCLSTRLTMKTVCILLLACVAYSVAFAVNDHHEHQFQADKTFLERQKQILKLFVRIQYPTVFKDIKDIADTYKIEDNLDKYTNQQDVKMFIYMYKNHLLFPRGQVTTLYEKQSVDEKKLLFDVLYYSEDYDTFYKTACWAREHVNEWTFVYSLMVAVYARQDTKYMTIPPMYEIYPYTFINEKVIQKAMDYYMTNPDAMEGKPYVIDMNCTGYMGHEYNHEKLLSYFTEDIGLNAFNLYWHMQYPQWYNSTKYGMEVDRRGELFLHVQQQLLSRYFMERMSNHMEEVSYVDPDMELPEFYPGLRYHTGETVMGRPRGMKMMDTRLTVHFMDENFVRIRESIDRCFIDREDNTKVPICNDKGINILGDMLYSYGDNPNMKLYGSFYNYMIYILAKVTDPEDQFGIPPSAMTLYGTMLRDPVYYQMIHTMYDQIVYKYRLNLPKNKYEDLVIPGVKIDHVDIDKLVTYYDDFYVSLSNVIGVKTEEELQKIDIRVKQQRLNHKPFNYRISVTSDKEMEVLVRMYLVPVYDIHGNEIDFETRARHIVEIDRFPYKVTSGQTVIERNSQQSTVGVRDPDNFRNLFKRVNDALDNKEPLMVDKYANIYGYPQRLLLPKGWKSGMPVRLVVRMDPLMKNDAGLQDGFEIDSVTMMGMPYGMKHPMMNNMNVALGRIYRSLYDAQLPNSYWMDVMIYHKSQDDMRNVVQN